MSGYRITYDTNKHTWWLREGDGYPIAGTRDLAAGDADAVQEWANSILTQRGEEALYWGRTWNGDTIIALYTTTEPA